MSGPSPPLDDEQDPTGFLQIERATRALEHTLNQEQPSAEVISASLKEGAMINRLDPWSWYQPLIQNDMVHSLCEILDYQGMMLPFAEERLAHALIESGSEAMFKAVFKRIQMLPESLFQVLGHAVEQDNLVAARKLLDVGATLYDPSPQGLQRLGGVLVSEEMFELLTERGYEFMPDDVLASAIGARGWTQTSADYQEAPRPALLARMLKAGLLKPSAARSECNPWLSLLRSMPRVKNYPEQMIACGCLLITHGVEIDLPRGIHLAGLWVLMKAGVTVEKLGEIVEHCEPWGKRWPGLVVSLNDPVIEARQMLIELDEAGLKMETLYPLNSGELDGERAFALAGCEMSDAVVFSVVWKDLMYLREHAILHRHTQATTQDPETAPARRRL